MTAARLVCPRCGGGAELAGRCPRDGATVAVADEPRLGTELGGYRLARVLGRGGMGVVYLGVQPAIDARVAIKVLTGPVEPVAAERFVREARAANAVAHDGVVRVFAAGVAPDGSPYLVMELVDGAPWSAVTARGPRSPAALIGLVLDALAAVGALHAAGVVHRDLKPSNLLVTADGRVKVIDLGVARARAAPSTLTAPGAVVGTAAYMAPEQAAGRPVDGRADLYALAVMLYEALVGQRPSGERPAPLAARAPALAPLDPVLARALAAEPADRFTDADALARALTEARAALPSEAPDAHEGTRRSERSREPASEPSTDRSTEPATAEVVAALPVTAELSAAPAPTPRRLGPYVLDEPLGVGATGAVVRAHDPRVERDVAIKLLHGGRGEPGRVRLLDEARRMARVSHPNVVHVYELGHDGGRDYLVMEYVPGVALDAWLAATPRSWREVAAVFVAVAHGLGAAHRAGVVHRDVKAANILVGDDGRVRIGDFGLAIEDGAATAGAGTPAFMAPEQEGGGPADPRWDQFALCASAWAALHGEGPYPGDTPAALVAAAQSGVLRVPARPVPAALTAVLRRGLAGDPAARFPDADALARALAASVGPGRRRWRAGLVAALVAAAVGVAWWAGRGARRADSVAGAASSARSDDVLARLAATPSLVADEALRRRAADALARGPTLRFEVDGPVAAMAFSADGRRLAIATDTSVTVRTLATGASTRLASPLAGPLAVRLDDDAVVVGDGAELAILTAGGAARLVPQCPPAFRSAPAARPGLRYAACIGGEGALVRDLARDRVVVTPAVVPRAVMLAPGSGLAVLATATDVTAHALPDGRVVASRSIDGAPALVVGEHLVALWRGRTAMVWRPATDTLSTREVSRDIDFAAVLDDRVIWLSADGRLTFTSPDGEMMAPSAIGLPVIELGAPVSNVLLAGARAILVVHPAAVTLVDVDTGLVARRAGTVADSAVSPDGGTVALADGATVTLWSPSLPAPVVTEGAQRTSQVWMASDGTGEVWVDGQRFEVADPATGRRRPLPDARRLPTALAGRVAWLERDGGVATATVAGDEPPRRWPAPAVPVKVAVPTRDGALVVGNDVVVSVPGGARCDGALVALSGHVGAAVVRRGDELVLCDLTRARQRGLGPVGPDTRVWFAGDTERLLLVERTGARVLDGDGRVRVLSFEPVADAAVAVAADGARALVAGRSGVVVLDLAAGGTRPGPALRGVTRLALAADGRAAALADGALVAWSLDDDEAPRLLGHVPVGPPVSWFSFVGDALVVGTANRLQRWSLATPEPATVLGGLARLPSP